MADKTCAHCKETKSVEQFTTNKQQKSGLCSYCKSCIRILRKTKWHLSPETIEKGKATAREKYRTKEGRRRGRNASYKSRYGFSLDAYEKMFNAQEGKCAMCRKPSDRFLVVDHDHVTDKVRALLCPRCNSFLGYIETDNLIIKQARSYLRKY